MNKFLHRQGESAPSEEAQIVKFGSGKRIKNFQRDVLFFQHFRAVRQGATHAGCEGTSVTHPHPSLPSTAPTPLPSSTSLSTSLSLEGTGAKKARRDPFERFVTGKASPSETHLFQSQTPAEWRDLTPWMQALYRHHAAKALGPVYSFSLNLRPDIEAMARTKPSAASWLQKRVVLEVGAGACFWFALEQASSRLHLHGEIVTDDPRHARAAFRKAAGEWRNVRQHQAHTAPDPNAGWVSYSLKDLPYTSRKSPAAHQRGFEGDPFASTQNLTGLAKQLYEADRKMVLVALRSK